MLYLRLPFFLLLLGLKNFESFARILIEAIGAQVLILLLIALNITFGALLYLELQKHQQLTAQAADKAALIERHKSFWRQILEQFPTHKTGLEAENLLNNAN